MMPGEKINVLIVEDESIVALDLAASLQHQGYAITGLANNATDAEKIFYASNPDVLLVDINLIGETDGITLVEKLYRTREVPVIYLTAMSDVQTLNRVKMTRPAAYLTKPYTMQNVAVAIELAISNLAVLRQGNTNSSDDGKQLHTETELSRELILQQEESIFIKHNYRFVKVPLKDILYVEADNNYIFIVTAHQKYMLRFSLQQLEQKIQYDKFIRIQRSFIVNINAIQSFSETEVQIGEQHIPVGRAYRDAFISRFHFR